MRSHPVKLLLLFVLSLIFITAYFLRQREDQIRLIVRGDNMGFSHAANLGSIKAYREGILTAVEIRVPGK